MARRSTTAAFSNQNIARSDIEDAAPRRSSIVVEAVAKSSSFFASLAAPVRHLVSKKKRRFQKDGFDLDLSYITHKIIAMGYPSTAMEAAYRNPAGQVKSFLAYYHPGHAKVYNLCIERQYAASIIGLPDELVEVHPGYDHNVLPLFSVAPFCRSVGQWLAADPRNIAAIHCKAGKGRTGMLICCYLVWSGTCESADAALALFGSTRTHNNKGVTIPSQQRYVHYTEKLVSMLGGPAKAARAPPSSLPMLKMPPLRRIQCVKLLHAPEFATQPSIYFTIELVHRRQSASDESPTESPLWQSWRVYDHRKRASANAGAVDVSDPDGAEQQPSTAGIATRMVRASFSVMTLGRSESVSGSAAAAAATAAAMGGTGVYEGMKPDEGSEPLVAGDVKLCVCTPNGKKLAACWFHTAFVDGDELVIGKLQLDKARKNKLLPQGFAVSIQFGKVTASEEASQREDLAARAQVSNRVAPGEEEDEDDDEDEDEEEPMRARREAARESEGPSLVAGAI